jgi:hypothetical protein
MARLRSRANPTFITIRAVRADDRERIVKAFRALDPGSIRQRFFVPRKELGSEELRRLTETAYATLSSLPRSPASRRGARRLPVSSCGERAP